MKKNTMLIALIEEYRKSASAYKHIIETIPLSLFEKIIDHKTNDKDCKSIQTISLHIVHSGYTYASYLNAFNSRDWYEYDKSIETPEIAIIEIDKMLNFTEKSLDGLWDKTNDEIESMKFKSRWKVTYDIEQLLEHAIVHVLRHRRQVENILKTQ